MASSVGQLGGQWTSSSPLLLVVEDLVVLLVEPFLYLSLVVLVEDLFVAEVL